MKWTRIRRFAAVRRPRGRTVGEFRRAAGRRSAAALARIRARVGAWTGRHRRGVRWASAGTAAVVLAIGVAPSIWLYAATSAHRHTVAGVPAHPVAIVLGAGLTPSGRPTPFLAARLDIAVELYGRGKVDAVLVSGDNSRDDYDEVGGMRDYLVDAGIPADKIAKDHAGFSTWESCTRARKVFGVRSATVVTQDFHLPRAVELCRAAGIDTSGVGDDQTDEHFADSAYGYVREVPAAGKAAVDAAVRPDPTFLGPRETTVADAVRAPRT